MADPVFGCLIRCVRMDSTIAIVEAACGMASSWHHILEKRLEPANFSEKGHRDGSYFGSYALSGMTEGPGHISGRKKSL